VRLEAYGWESELYFTSDEEDYVEELQFPYTPPLNMYVEEEEEDEEDEVVEETVEEASSSVVLVEETVEASSSVVFLPPTPTDVSFVGETPSPTPGPSRRTPPLAAARLSPYSRR
jgi:hypothetical protein